MLSKPLNNGDFYETHVAYRLALIHSIAVQTDNLSSKVTHENAPNAPPRFKNVIFRHHYVTQKNSRCIETEQSYLCKVLYFNRQNLMLIRLPKD